ncbi:hypothetical protein B0H13DRAFT_2300737 [Mycena leptocephala]|nr:hypothetical protein B0H13DRAFT_2300737 [Mycena leptocephala]
MYYCAARAFFADKSSPGFSILRLPFTDVHLLLDSRDDVFVAHQVLLAQLPKHKNLRMEAPVRRSGTTNKMQKPAGIPHGSRYLRVPIFLNPRSPMVALYRHGGEIPKDTHSFDLSNPLHLMAAASSGGVNTGGFAEADIKEWEKIDVLRGSVPGRGPALVRADEYRPMFNDTLALWSLPRQRNA